jgi:hypothetical protein
MTPSQDYKGKLILINEFHDTEAAVIVKNGILTSRQMDMACNKLCGIDGCCCGGIRGDQDADICWIDGHNHYRVFKK